MQRVARVLAARISLFALIPGEGRDPGPISATRPRSGAAGTGSHTKIARVRARATVLPLRDAATDAFADDAQCVQERNTYTAAAGWTTSDFEHLDYAAHTTPTAPRKGRAP